jgi:transporter family-2 protein
MSPVTDAAIPRRRGPWPVLAALGTGGCLTLMLLCNAEVGRHAGALAASLVPHATGAVVAAVALALTGAAWRGRDAPGWAYLGGLSGAVTVMVTAAAANTALALSGTLALGLVGQVLFARAADAWGLFGLPRRRMEGREAVSALLILAGSALILMGAA